jgi:hypothetical protein
MGKPTNVIFDQLAKSGYQIEVLSSAFPNSSIPEIQQRLVETELGLLRTVERFGYLGMQPCESQYMNIDKFGNRYIPKLRDQTSREFCQENTHRILVHVYGGSTTLGAHVGDDETIPYFLLKKFQARGYENVVVVNCGGNNHTSLHCVLHFLDDCLKGQIPDYAVFLNGWNDAMHADGGGDGIVDFLNACLAASQSESQESRSVFEIRSSIQSISRGSYRNRRILSGDYYKFLRFFKMRYKSAIGLAHEISQIFGSKVKFFFEPSAFVSCRKDQDLMPKIRELSSATPMVAHIYKELSSIGVQKFLGDKKFELKKVKSLISCGQERETFPLFIDDCHFTPQFNNYLSREIARDFSPRVKKISMQLHKFSEQSENPSDDSSNYPLW